MSARFVVDNSVVMSWCFEDEGNGYAEAVLDLAMRLDLPLSTQDASLVKAARKCKVPAYKPTHAR